MAHPRFLKLFLLSALALASSGCGYVVPLAAGAFFGGSKGGSGSVVILIDDEAELIVGRGVGDSGSITEGKGVELVAAQFQFTATKDTTIRSLALQSSGTGDDSAIPAVRLHRDLNNDGILDTEDLLLGSTTFSGDDGVASFGDLALNVAGGKSVSLLVVVQTPATAAEGATFRVTLAAGSVVADTVNASGQVLQTPVFGVPLVAGTKTVSSVGSLTARLGGNSPLNKTAFANSTDVSVVQLELRASTVEAITVSSVRFKTSGSGDDLADVTKVGLYVDQDGDGLLNIASDRALATGLAVSGDEGTITVSGLSETIAAGKVARWLVVYDFAGSAVNDDVFRVDLLAGSDLTAVGAASAQPIVASGTPVGDQVRIVGSTAQVSLTQGGLATTNLTPGQKDLPGLRMIFSETSGLTPAVLDSVALTGSGTAQEQSDVERVGLWRDVNQDGLVDGGDVKLGAVSFVIDDGRVVFSGLNETVPAGGALHILATFDISVPPGVVNGETLRLSVAGTTDVSLKETTTLIPVIPSGVPLAGPVTTTSFGLPAIVISQGAAAPASDLRPLQTDAPILHLVLTETTSTEAALLSQLRLTASGTGGDDTDLIRVRLWRDNGNGTFDGSPTDTALASATYPSNNGQAVFPLSEVIPAGMSQAYFATYDMGGVTQVVPAETYAMALSATADVTLKAQVTGFTVTPTGLPQTGATHTAVGPAITVTLGPAAPASSPLPTQTEVPVLDVFFAEGSGDGAVNLSRLVVTGSGTGDEALDLTAVKLWRDAATLGTFEGSGGDVLLATGAYAANDGSITFATNENIPSSGNLRLFVSYDFASSTQVSAGDDFRARINALGDVSLSAVTGGFTVTPTAAVPLTGNLQTATLPVVTLTQGAGSPAGAGSIAALQSNVPMLHLVLTESANVGAVDFTRLVVTASGSGQDELDVTNVKLWRDANTNATFDGLAGDVLIGAGTFSANNGTIAFSLSESIASSGNRAYFVTYDFASSTQVASGETYALSVAASGDLSLSANVGAYPITAGGTPQNGFTQTASLPAVNLTLGTGAPAASIAPLHSDTPVMHLILTESNGLAVDLSRIALTASGTGNDATDLIGAKLWRDAGAIGTFEGAAGDVLIGAGTYSSDDGGIAFVVSETIPASNFRGYFVTYDFAGSSQVTTGETYRTTCVAASDLTLSAAIGGAPVVATGGTLPGNLLSAAVPTIAVTLGAGASGGNITPGQTDVAVLHLILSESTSDGDVDLSRLAVTASGSGNDATDLSAARLWRDTGSGAFEGAGTDVLLASGGFTNDDGQIAFLVSETITSGGARQYFVTYDFSVSNVSSGETFAAAVVAPSDLTLRGAVNGFVVTPTGLPRVGGTKTATLPAVNIQTAGGAPGGVVNPEQTQIPALSVLISESTGNGDAKLTRLAVRASGSGEDDLDLSAVQLWRDTGSGLFEGSGTDTLLATGSYLANDGQVVFALNETITTSTSNQYFVVYSMAGGDQVTSGQTYVAEITAASDVTLTSAVGGAPLTLTGTLPSTGPTLTAAESPIVAVSQGVALPAITVRPDEADRPALQLRLTNSAVAAVGSLTSLTVRGAAAETGNDDLDLVLVELWRDVDQDGAVTSGDVKIGVSTFFTDPGRATFTGLNEGIAAGGGTLDLLITFDMASAVEVNNPAGETYAATVQAGDVEIFAAGGYKVPPTGTFPQTGPQLTAGPSVAAGLAVSQFVAIANTTVSDSETDVEMIQLRIARTGTGEVQLNSLRVTAAGTAPDQTDVQFIKLWRDQGALGVRDAGDVQIGLSAYFVDNGSASFSIAEVVSTSTLDLLVTYDLAGTIASGATFNLSVGSGGVGATRVADGQPATVAGLAQVGPTHQKPSATIFLVPTLVSPAGFTNDVVRDLAAGFDLDEDGKEDVVALRSGSFEVLEGDGLGGFGAVNASTAIVAPSRLAIGDMDRDGDLDVVVIRPSVIEIHPNDGSGNFVGVPSTLTLAGSTLVDLQLLDYDRDGDLDVVLLDTAGGGALRGVTNNGLAALTDANTLALTGPAATPRRLALADVDRDGFVDAVVTDSNGGVRLASGGAAFFTFVAGPYPTGGSAAQDVVLADLDRNGRSDAIVVDEATPNSNLYTLQGASGPPALSAGAGPLDTSPGAADYKDARDLVQADWTGDGKVDVAVVHAYVAAGTEGVAAHIGDGTFTFSSVQEVNLGSAIDHDRIATGDLNGDGDPDLIVASSTVAQTGVSVILGEGDTNGGALGYGAPSTYAWGNTSEEVAVGDFDLDGDLDFAIAGTESVVGVFKNDGAGTAFTFSQDLATGARARHVEVADVNRDGKPDLVVVASGTSLLVFLNDGSGGFGPGASDSEATGNSPRHVSLADLNQDGILDAVVSEHNDDTFQIYLGDGTGFAAPVGGNQYSTADQPRESRIADYDGDGDLDILVLSHTGLAVEFFPNNIGTFTFGGPTTTSVDASLSQGDHFQHGDLNGDGRLDLVVVSRHASVFEVFSGNGDGSFTSQGQITAGPYRDVLLVDTDKDGDLDLVFSRQDGANELVVQENQGGFTFGAAVVRTMTGTPLGIAAGDFNRDGEVDILAAVSSTQNAQVFLGN